MRTVCILISNVNGFMIMNRNDSKVLILTHTPEPEKICAAAARISTTFESAVQNYENASADNAGELVAKVLHFGHKSFIEHANFTIAFENVSAFVEQFMIEFRLASFTIKSRRYVNFGNMGYYIPDFRFSVEISERKKREVARLYKKHMNYLFFEYNYLVDSGVPKEDARFILPYSYKSNFYCSVNARELAHIIYSAIYGRGSRFLEIKSIGESLLKQAEIICPSIFENIKVIEEGREDKELRLRELFDDKVDRETYSSETCELISYTTDPEIVVALAVIIGHTLYPTSKIKKLISEDQGIFYQSLKIACEDRRRRELEQIYFTFRINNISLAGLTHLVRHRMQSINVPSFTEFGNSTKYIIPVSIASNLDLLSRYKSVWERHRSVFHLFKSMRIIEEDLVYLYLSGNVLDVVTTMNARELFHFIRLRTCNRAQWEIRSIAIDMLKKLRKVAPNIFKGVGPSCFILNFCPEGRLTCGKMEEVQEIFRGG